VWRATSVLSRALALFACRSRVDAVATVNGRVITRQAFDKAVHRALSKYQSPDSKSPLPSKLVASTSRRVLYQLIEDELISQKAKSLRRPKVSARVLPLRLRQVQVREQQEPAWLVHGALIAPAPLGGKRTVGMASTASGMGWLLPPR
jgi:hypothetical protein